MEYRSLGNTGMQVSAVSFGTWAIGGSWGQPIPTRPCGACTRAMDAGVNFFDTADVYGDGRSEEMLGRATKGKEDEIYIATKFCRSLDIHDPATYSEPTVRRLCEGSLRRLGRERIDLYQIHCPPHEVLKRGDVFEVLDKLKEEGKVRTYGVSVESVEEGLTALQWPGVQALQVIFNVFRQKPLEELFPKAYAQGVGILARLPLASGLLTGKFTPDTTFPEDDHRNFNRDGAAFNVGETFAGLPFAKGVALAEQLRWMAEGRRSMAAAAIRWILSFKEVSCAIPGFKTAAQVEENLSALEAPPFEPDELARAEQFYKEEVLPHIRGPY